MSKLTETRDSLKVGHDTFGIYALDKIPGLSRETLAASPRTIRVIAENLLRHEERGFAHPEIVHQLLEGRLPESQEVPFFPGRVLLQDFTGVPLVVDLTAIRAAAKERGAPVERVNPQIPVDLVVDHSVQVDSFARPNSLLINLDREYDRNAERYQLLRWASEAFQNFRVVPPGNGIVHQVNLEHLASVVDRRDLAAGSILFPDTLVGTDSHTTMVNGLGVLGWGVGGIEAESVLLGEPTFLSAPRVVGVELTGELPPGVTATDVVLTVTRTLRQKGVVDRFVEFFGSGVEHLTVPDRATISNMCPEYGATAALFPIDKATLAYLRATGRDPALVNRVEAYARRQSLFRSPEEPDPKYADVVRIDLAKVVPTVSGPKNPEEAIPLSEAPKAIRRGLEEYRKKHPRPGGPVPATTHPYPADDPMHPFDGNVDLPERAAKPDSETVEVPDGAVVIAAITSCTNTSNPSVMIGAGLIAKRARELGLRPPPYVKTSLAPGSKVVTDYLRAAGLLQPLEELGFGVVGYGCTTCIGNSGPLPPAVDAAVRQQDAYVAAVLSGNRNFEARIHNLVRANFLASPMLVVLYALAGRMDIDLSSEPVATTPDGRPVYLKELWPSSEEVRQLVETTTGPELFRKQYRSIREGDRHWNDLNVPTGSLYPSDPKSTYIQNPPYFSLDPPATHGPVLIGGARALAVLGDAVSTDHISPAGEIQEDSPAGRYLKDHGVPVAEFNTYGARRGNHEVMIRGTFANIRLKNALVAPQEGGVTVHWPDEATTTIYEAAEHYRAEKVPLVVLAGASYGQGSSRDWAAKGPRLLGVRAVIAKSYERIHRSNLVGMGVLPLEFQPGEGVSELGLSGRETFEVRLNGSGVLRPRSPVRVRAAVDGRSPVAFETRCRIDSETEFEYFRAGGLMPYVLGKLSSSSMAGEQGRSPN